MYAYIILRNMDIKDSAKMICQEYDKWLNRRQLYQTSKINEQLQEKYIVGLGK